MNTESQKTQLDCSFCGHCRFRVAEAKNIKDAPVYYHWKNRQIPIWKEKTLFLFYCDLGLWRKFGHQNRDYSPMSWYQFINSSKKSIVFKKTFEKCQFKDVENFLLEGKEHEDVP